MSQKTDEPTLARFLELLAEGHSVKHACEEAGVGRTTVYERRDSDTAFKAAWDEANEAGVEVLEEEARRRAVEGVEDFKAFGDSFVPIRRYSDTLLIFLLKAKRPAVYRERVEHTGPDGGPIRVAIEEARERLDARLAGLAERRGAA